MWQRCLINRNTIFEESQPQTVHINHNPCSTCVNKGWHNYLLSYCYQSFCTNLPITSSLRYLRSFSFLNEIQGLGAAPRMSYWYAVLRTVNTQTTQASYYGILHNTNDQDKAPTMQDPLLQ